jgi:dTDP-4-dehydrorhamnose reductase
VERVLIVGYGTLGQALARSRWLRRAEIHVAHRRPVADPDAPVRRFHLLDIAGEAGVRRFFAAAPRFSLVINCAAFTDVDGCEREPAAARATNARGVLYLARACARRGAAFLHVSTNYVFPGTGRRALREDDPTGPSSVYGLTKLEGEIHALGAPRAVVVRTSWIFGGGKRDFVNHFLEKFEKEGPVPVVADQTASLTFARDLADAIGTVVTRELGPSRGARRFRRIYHLVNAGAATRYRMLLEMRRILGKSNPIVRVGRSEFSGWQAVRPAYSVLSGKRFERRFGKKLRHWKSALREHLHRTRSGGAGGGDAVGARRVFSNASPRAPYGPGPVQRVRA